MSGLEITLFLLAVIIMLVGLLGTVLPGIPGVPLVFFAAVVYGWLTDFTAIDGDTLLLFGLLTVISLLLDWLATAFGVRKMGGSYFGVLGAFLGMIVVLFLPGVGLVGFLLGAFAGALLFELLIGKDSKTAFQAGIGSFIGFVAGGLMKFVIAAVMIGMFVWKVLL